MILNKVTEIVEYYVVETDESPDAVVYDEKNKVTRIRISDQLPPILKDLYFVYVGNFETKLRYGEKNDYIIKDGYVIFNKPLDAKGQNVIIKLYTRHDSDVEKKEIAPL